jgi:hypothetical protein
VARKEKSYSIRDINFDYEIKTFIPDIGQVFNEFKIVDKRDEWGKIEISLFLDENADGTLDNVLRGKISLTEAQDKYALTIAKGLSEKEMVKINGSIIIKN